jgi:hypothetical protein
MACCLGQYSTDWYLEQLFFSRCPTDILIISHFWRGRSPVYLCPLWASYRRLDGTLRPSPDVPDGSFILPHREAPRPIIG